MEACLLIKKANKEKHKRGKILFINAVDQVRQDKTMSFLEEKHIDKIFKAYRNFTDKPNFAALMAVDDVLANNGNMAINLYVRTVQHLSENEAVFSEVYEQWEQSSAALKESMNKLFEIIQN